METVRAFLQVNKGRWLWAAAAFLLAALLPEYVFPLLCLTAYLCTVRRCVSLRSTEKAMLVYMAWSALAVSYSGAKASALAILLPWCLFFFGSRMLLSTVDNADKLNALFLCGAASGGIAGGIAILQMVLFHFGGPLKKMFNPFWHLLDMQVADLAVRLLPQSVVRMLPRTQFIAIADRASGTFTNPLFLAVFLCMMAPFCTYCLFYFHRRATRIFAALCLLLCVGGIAVSYSRGPYLALCIVFFVMLFYGRKYAWKLLCTAGALLVGLSLFAGGVFRRLLTLFSGRDISVNTRSQIWKACFEMLRGHWLFGYGTGVGNVRNMLHENYRIRQPHAHNLFLQILLEQGVIGLALFGAILILFLRNLYRLAKKGDIGRGIAVTLLGSLAGFCACGMTDYLFYGMKPLCYFLMLIALSECALRIYTEDKPPCAEEPAAKELVTQS